MATAHTKERHILTYEDWIVAVAAEAPKLSGSALKLLLHLASVSIQAGTTQVRISDRDLETRLDICRPALTDAKRALAHLIGIESRAGVPSTFNLPAGWFPGQRPLFSPQVANFPSQQWPGKLATTGQQTLPPLAKFSSQSGQENWPGGQETLPPVANKTGQVANKTSQSGQETLPPATGNEQLAGAGDDRSRSIDLSTTTDKYVKIDLILDCVEIPSSLRSDAELLGNNLWVYAQQRGTGAIAERQPSDELVAKCLAIAGVDSLLIALAEAAEYKNSRPASYWWFVAVFLQKIHGIPSSMLRERLDQRRMRKPARRAELLPFPDQLVQQAAGQVKSLR